MKLLASDLDFTILMHGDPDLTKKNVAAIKKFIAAGNKFAIITGRQYRTFKDFLEEYDLHCDYIAGEDGKIIFDKDLNEVFRKNIAPATLDIIYDLALKYNFEVNFDDGYHYHHEKIYNAIKVFFSKKEVEGNKEFLDKMYTIDNLNIYFSVMSFNIVEGNLKYEALDFIKERENLSFRDIYAVGDGVADIEMIKRYNGEMLGKRYKYLYQYIEKLMKD